MSWPLRSAAYPDHRRCGRNTSPSNTAHAGRTKNKGRIDTLPRNPEQKRIDRGGQLEISQESPHGRLPTQGCRPVCWPNRLIWPRLLVSVSIDRSLLLPSIQKCRCCGSRRKRQCRWRCSSIHDGGAWISWANVKEHATLSARARVDHGVEVECRKGHENRAADRGCVSRLVGLGEFRR
jgi:hypothetical protein